jgi:hypothetical protein
MHPRPIPVSVHTFHAHCRSLLWLRGGVRVCQVQRPVVVYGFVVRRVRAPHNCRTLCFIAPSIRAQRACPSQGGARIGRKPSAVTGNFKCARILVAISPSAIVAINLRRPPQRSQCSTSQANTRRINSCQGMRDGPGRGSVLEAELPAARDRPAARPRPPCVARHSSGIDRGLCD